MPTYDLPLKTEVSGVLLLVHTRFGLTINLRYNDRDTAISALQEVTRTGFYKPADPREAFSNVTRTYYPAHVIDSVTIMNSHDYYALQAKIKEEQPDLGDLKV